MMAAFSLGRRRSSGQDLEPRGLLPVPTVSQGAAPPELPTYSPGSAPVWLAAVSALPEVLAYKEHSYELLHLEPGLTLLDVGCGVGTDVRSLAPRLAPGGDIVAVDGDPQMIAAAQSQQAAAAPSPVPLRFVCAPAEHLPVGNATVDVVRVDRVLQHVQSPQVVLAEIQRVLRPGGRIVVVEPDWGMVAIYPPSATGDDDNDSTLAVILRHAASTIPHPLIGRRLRALLRDAGYVGVWVEPVAYSTARFEVADLGLELSATVDAISAGEPSGGGAAQAWLAAARSADAAGRFFASVPLIFACATTPS